MNRYESFHVYEDCGQEMDTVEIPHQPLKAFKRDLDVDFSAEESNAERVRRELKSLQERLSLYYCMGREERERHRNNILRNLNQLDLYWFECDDFDEAMFRFRCAWTNHLVDESIQQLYRALSENLKDLWSLEYEIGYICEELMNRLILDNTIPEYEKALLGNELNNFRKDGKAHIQEVDNFHYELREMVKGINMKKLRGLTKDEYKEKVHSIISFLEKAEVPLHVFKSVGFDLKRTDEVSVRSIQDKPVRTGVEEKDYESE